METELIINDDIAVVSAAEVTKKLAVKEGVTKVTGTIKKIEIGCVTTSEDGYDYIPVTITLKDGIPAYLSDDSGKFVMSSTPLVFTTLDVIASILRDNDDIAHIVNNLLRNPSALEMILPNSKVEILQQFIAKGTKFINPYSSKRKVKSYEHDLLTNNITSFTIGKMGIKLIDAITLKAVELCVIN